MFLEDALGSYAKNILDWWLISLFWLMRSFFDESPSLTLEVESPSSPSLTETSRLLERTQPGHFVESPSFAFAGLSDLQLRLYPKGELCQETNSVDEFEFLENCSFLRIYIYFLHLFIFFFIILPFHISSHEILLDSGHGDSQLRSIFELSRAVPAQWNDVHRRGQSKHNANMRKSLSLSLS